MEAKGKLIVVEGVDGAGKGVQMDILKARLKDIRIFKYPTSKYPMLNDYLVKKLELEPKALFLLFLSDISNQQAKVKAALEQGKTVILDRYVFSTIAYEVDGGLGFDRGKRIVESCDLLRPDMVILLDIPPEVSQERKRKQKKLDRYEADLGYLARVRANFLRLSEERFLTRNWHTIDATGDVESIHKEIVRLIAAFV